MAEPLVTVGPGNELEAGVFPSVDQLSAPFWFDSENVEFLGGGVATSKGWEEIATVPGPVFELEQAFHEGDQRVYASVENDVIMVSSLTGLSILGSFPSTGFPYFETFGSFLLGTNYVDPPRYWKNTGTFDEIPGVPFTFAKLLHRRDNHIIAFNTSNGQNAYEWCSASDVEDWVPDAANSAGNGWIRDLDSEIIAAVDIGAQVAVYSRETMGLVRFVGQPFVFQHTPAINGVGAVGARSVVQVGTRNFGLNRQGVFETDGISFQYVDEPAVHEYIVGNIDFDRGETIRGYHNEYLASVIWFFDTRDGQRKGLGYNYQRRGFRKYGMGISIALERQIFDTPIAALGTKIVRLGVGDNAHQSPLPKWIRTKPISAQNATLWKYWSHLKTVGKWNAATVRFGALEDPTSEDIEWFDEQEMSYENWIDRDAVFIVLEFRADELDSRFSFSQLQLLGTQGAVVSA